MSSVATILNNQFTYRESCPNCLVRWGKYSVALILFIPIQIMKIAGCALSCFGFYNNFIAKAVKTLAYRLSLACISHVSQDQTHCKHPVLCPLRNSPDISTLLTYSDQKLYTELIKKLPYPLKNKVSLSPPPFNTKGICYGASLVIIKALQKEEIRSEEELINCIRPFIYGFPAEAVTLQYIMKFIYPIIIESEILSYNGQLIPSRHALWNSKATEIVGRLIDLTPSTYESNTFTTALDTPALKEEFKSRFNALESGYYTIFICSRHMIVYLKTEFGSYLIDSNKGLIQCEKEDPFIQLNDLLFNYESDSQKQALSVMMFLS